MAAFTAQLKRIILCSFSVIFIVIQATLTAGSRPAQAEGALIPGAQPVPAAPAAAFAELPEASTSVVAVVPQPRPVPVAPGAPLAEIPHAAERVQNVPAANGPLPLMGLVVAAALLVTAALFRRQTSPHRRAAVC